MGESDWLSDAELAAVGAALSHPGASHLDAVLGKRLLAEVTERRSGTYRAADAAYQEVMRVYGDAERARQVACAVLDAFGTGETAGAQAVPEKRCGNCGAALPEGHRERSCSEPGSHRVLFVQHRRAANAEVRTLELRVELRDLEAGCEETRLLGEEQRTAVITGALHLLAEDPVASEELGSSRASSPARRTLVLEALRGVAEARKTAREWLGDTPQGLVREALLVVAFNECVGRSNSQRRGGGW